MKNSPTLLGNRQSGTSATLPGSPRASANLLRLKRALSSSCKYSLAALVAASVASHAAHGTTLSWNAAGDGTWNNTATSFNNGTTDVALNPYVAVNTSQSTPVGSYTLTLASVSGLAIGQYLSINNFAAGTTIASIDTTNKVVTLSTSATKVVNSGATVGFVVPNDVVFGSSTQAAGTIAVTGTQAVGNMTINASQSGNYTFTGGSLIVSAPYISSTTGTNQLTVNANATINSNLTAPIITLAGTSLSLGGGGTLVSVQGSTSTNRTTSTLTLTNGNYTLAGASSSLNIGNINDGTSGVIVGNGATLISLGTMQIGTTTNGLVTVQTGGALNVTSSGLAIGRNTGGNGRLVISGGSVTLAGATPLLVGFSGASSGVLDITAGTLSAGEMGINVGQTSATATATVNISGGTVTTGTVNFGKAGNWASTHGNATLNQTGGSLYVGNGGIVKNGVLETMAINLSGGTVGATADWSSSLNMNLGTTNGNITFQAANASNVAHNIALSGTLSGAGGLYKTGGGLLTLSAANTYQGTTTITSGTLSLGTAGSIANSPLVNIGSGSTLDVSAQTTTFAVGSSQTVNNNGTVKGNTNVSGWLKGTGTISGSLNITSGGTLAPGNSAGIQVVTGDLNVGTGGFVSFDIAHGTAGTNYDQIQVGGSLTLAGTLELTLGPGIVMGDVFDLILHSGDSALTTTFETVSVYNAGTDHFETVSVTNNAFTYGGQGYVLNYNANLDSGTIGNDLTLQAVPEPSTWAMLAGGLGALIGFQRMRRKNA